MRNRIHDLAKVTAIMTMLLLAGCIGQEEEVGRTQLIIAMPFEIDILDTQQATWSDVPNFLVSQPLVCLSMDLGTIVPDAAESWEVSANGKVITWHLPKDYKYSNGDPLDAQALADAWWRYKEISPYAEDLGPIIEMNVIDDTTLEVVHDNPPAFMWAVLVTDYGAPWDAAEAARVGDEEFGRNTVGSGPFKLKEWVEGSHMLFERNNNYKTNLPFVENKGPPHLEEVRIRFIEEDLTRVSEIEAGTVDIITEVPSSEVARLQKNPDIEVLDNPTPGMSYLVFNNQRPPFDDVKVRGAFSEAIDREDLVTTLAGTVEPQYALLAPAQLCYSEEMQQYAKNLHPYNVDAAKALLAEAGWTDTDGDGIVDKDGNPFSVALLVPTDDPPLTKIGVVIQAQLQAIGLDVTIESYARMYIRDLMDEGDYDLGLGRVSWQDPDILIYRYTEQGANYANVQIPEVEEKLLEARYIMDMEERTAAYEEIQKILIDEVVGVMLFSRKGYMGVRTWVKDLVFHRLFYGQMFLNDVTIKKEE